ncbi:hypothetical protein [Streptomyces botrytidirepellens]|uniref:Uncharacterized protein n=1 Tax=Streptomyces botrytidirepellens TaxID=2486417 RepID=A0A3M8WTM3_9ACTN|nr:hypothetical protein [Streptomyces botrytidirepellens]RNG33512.1 hypothetical protein EEJ42_07340 [Streptomyces botrytidirepellens]
MATDLVSGPTRTCMREISAQLGPSRLQPCGDGSGFTPGPPKDTSGAQGKNLFSSYADHITWSDPEQVARALGVFERMLRAYRTVVENSYSPEGETPQQRWAKRLEGVRREFEYDGYQITEGLRIQKAGESRPDHEMADDQLYAEALGVLRHARNQIERLPSVTRDKGEEAIRDVLLVALGAAFAGRCTAESLNGAGKTDLLLRIGDRNVLVGECKIWPGSKRFPDAVDQLFGYLTRYDRFAVLPLFIRAARPEEIVAKAAQVLSEHPRCVSAAVPDDDSRQYKFVLRSPSSTPWDVEVALIPFVIS